MPNITADHDPRANGCDGCDNALAMLERYPIGTRYHCERMETRPIATVIGAHCWGDDLPAIKLQMESNGEEVFATFADELTLEGQTPIPLQKKMIGGTEWEVTRSC